jgi:ligand-binding SRPBCC domain-containing protein
MPKPKPVVTVIERREEIPRSAAEVFAFLDRPANLKKVFPADIAVSLEGHPADLRPGTLFRYRLNRWPLDVSWVTVVSHYRPPAGFTNVKARGYFPRWELEHELLQKDPGSELVMRLSYEVPPGIYAAMTNNYVVREAMEELVSAQIRAVREALV